MPETSEFKACYRHPRRPAIKNCQYCERPICAECERESGDHRLCGPCKKSLTSPAGGAGQAELRQETLMLGEVTVFDDGAVIEPGMPVAEEHETLPESDDTASGEPEVPEARPDDLTEAARAGAAPVEAHKAGSDLVNIAVEEKSGLRQIAYALPFALGTALVAVGLWFLIALILKQWTQISAMTLGLAVPWVFYNATTRKKRDGAKVWGEAPVVLVAIFSFTIVALAIPLMEYLVYQLVFSGFMESKVFSKDFFDGFGWTMISLGLLFSMLTPFLLKIGGRWDVPQLKFRRRRKFTGV